ncbi:uncharacterized protein VTP21DRAFT_7824 [Calcarisporiella thermophila]|uniref:uncharacterized protein n=1 Tax=Calcarisporiella thermophila TaxID=911321 RepID=UPI0037436EBC
MVRAMPDKNSNKNRSNTKKDGSNARRGKSNERNKGPITVDPRFAHVHNDPRFKRPKKKDQKVVIDKRFSVLLKDKEYTGAPKVDKYGRPIASDKAKEDLKRYYKLDEEDESDSVEDSSDEEKSLEDLETLLQKEEEEEEEEEEEKRIYDPARGEGVLSSSDESDIEEYDDKEESEEAQESSIPLGEETRRIAVVNMDWDHVRATDLMKVFSGFKPSGGVIRSIKIYPSEFGKERLEKEAREGPPKEIFKDVNSSDVEDEEEINEKTIIKEDSGEEFNMEQLRKYQLERLRYYYAVIDCDTVQTARALYEACDGREFESSSNYFDMRFIPDEMEFTDEPKDVCTQAPDNYKRIDFVTDALQHSKVKLTWDDDDPDRMNITRRKFTKEDLKDMDFKSYLASSDEDDEDDEEKGAAMREKYRSLLNGSELPDDDVDKEMEITFAPGLSEAAAELLEKKKQKEAQENETSLETYLRKQREKKQAKKQAKQKRTEQEENQQDEQLLFSDDDVNYDPSDPFFAEEIAKDKPSNEVKSKGKKKKSKEERKEAQRQRAELELLVMDSEKDGRKHFNMKEIIKAEKRKGKKGGKKKTEELQDDFEIDVQDPRFSAVLESHHFAIDPTNPQFKKTKAMSKVLEERRKRQMDSIDEQEKKGWSKNKKINENKKASQGDFNDPSLSLLVDSVKRKSTQNIEGNRKKTKL